VRAGGLHRRPAAIGQMLRSRRGLGFASTASRIGWTAAAAAVRASARLTVGSIIIIVTLFIICHFITVSAVTAACYDADQRRRETN